MLTSTITRLLFAGFLATTVSCCTQTADITPEPPAPPVVKNDIEVWLTRGDGSAKLQKQTTALGFLSAPNTFQTIEILPEQKFQSVDGFGYTLTGGSVEVINRLTAAKKQQLLQELFGSAENSIGVSYLRLSIGASDLNSEVFSYNDLPAGETDLTLSRFSLAKDQPVIDMLKEILKINPNIKIMAAPWSPPVWMKDNGNSVGGSLKPEFYSVYAQYFVKYIQEMKKEGITVDAVTPQNEPLHPGNNPSLLMLASQQADFIKNHLGPAFRNAGISTKIVIYDHNLDRPDYPLEILNDPAANAFIDGTAFHLYAGDISTMATIRNSFPGKNLYFTEQYTGSSGEFAGDLKWHLKNVIIGSMRNWSKIALEWNVANDTAFKPHTPGGCTTCRGAITINSADSYTQNVAYYIVGHASKFVPPGSVRLQSTQAGNVFNVAFITPAGKTVVIAENDGAAAENFNIKINGKWATTSLPAGAVATYIF